MKKSFVLLCFMFCGLLANAQVDNGYVLLPGPSQTLLPNQSMNLYVQQYLPYGEPESQDSLSEHVVNWTVNGKDAAAISPADGTVKFGATAEDAKTHLTYTAPSVAPAKNPVAIAVIVKTKGKGELFLICNVTIVKAKYKLTMDAEETGPEGIHFKLKGECFTNLKPLADGTFMLEPVDKSRSMYITVEDATAADAGGGSAKLLSPKQYKVPFLFTIGNMGKSRSQSAKAVCYLTTLSPQKGKVTWLDKNEDKTVVNIIDIDNGTVSYDGHAQPIPGLKGSYYTDAFTNLNLLQYLSVGDIFSNANQNIDNADKQMELAKKMQANMNNPGYFQTAQGKKEMQQLLSQQQQVGGNITNTGNLTKTQEAMIRKKALSNPEYAGSAQFKKDMTLLKSERINDKFRYQKAPMSEVTPGSARARIEDSFNPKGSEVFNGILKGTEGPIEVTINIKVEKIQ